MKNISIYLILLVAALSVTSCSDDYLDMNDDPNNPTSVSPDLILPVAQAYSANLIFYDGPGARHANTLGNLMVYNWSQADGYSWYYDEFQYLVNANFYDQIWDDTYNQPLRNYQELLNYEGAIYNNYKAIAKVMMSYHFQMLIDAYGDIPYTEALQRGSNTTPAYDDAQAVYDSLIVDLTEAIDLIDEADNVENVLNPGAADVMYQGDMEAWKRLANTVKLRILIRESGLSDKQAYIQEEINQIVNQGSGFITENASVNPGYQNEEGKQNPFWRSFGLTVAGNTQNNYQATTATPYVLDMLSSNNDPRINYIYEQPDSGHKGVPQGLQAYPDELTSEFVSNIGPGLLKSPDQDAPILTAAESYFLQSEAALKGYLDDDAQTLYESGIAASFDYLETMDLVDTDNDPSTEPELIEADPADYYSQNIENVGWDASSDKLEAIITQKWIALNGINGFEAWIEYNRTGYPSNLPISLLAPGDNRPVRLYYPSSERAINASNVPAQPNAFTDKIFWAN
ncbi:SusD/RagB family nutrient-binding outer membrane lipoprotein [Zunongwangia sp. F363]|uniref:SusD/RagB family nutrient-binding outer membrane lipoprotein n=1 Tax=Autumnicola tepida TaxID=3075595 RepID=A0ABU3C7K5_9FLAO|nr:SusD/RagB family nutrient-binding outer membrane lipoprotein [Zunongwangia sp. F363]MDT0642322.1 SusD/RagB family nutrient-binding outer membrane lipoprotein [Zunongwangia sp. F363]